MNVRAGALWLLLSGMASGAAATATFTLATSGVQIAPLAIGGYDFGNWMPVADMQQGVQATLPTSLRFPGGNVGDENDLTEAALRAFKSNLSLIGGHPALIVQTRVFASKPEAHNRPQDAAQAARDARALGLNVAYWEVGNEPDLYATHRNAPQWTPEQYCTTFRAQRAAILSVDPQAKFAGPAVSNGAGSAADFLTRFVQVCGDVVDLLTWHEYPTDGTQPDDAALASVARMSDDAQRFRTLLKDPAGNPLGYTRDVLLGVTEYSLSYRSDRPRHLADQVGALWAAETTLRLAEAGVSVSNYFALLATGSHGLLDLAGVPRPSFYAFQQIRSFQGTALPATSSDPALWIHAAQNGAALSVFVTNTATDSRQFVSSVPGYTLIGGKTFTEQSADAGADFLRLPLKDMQDLPARSLTRLVYKKQ
ncbi:GH39 family glycosyl hydrolase [Deinococcus ruber]|uniref:Glycosyl hydrolases family 39 N-terminal catalytic domain-containing protein n=1 Tax=Deinococcus ruber TaxID=1848197 RepID=A0A918CAA9_9DEIO|nr:hypothetical protein [Deinococcus ruber]GGR13781.1 hypothetical protein GCM10008957_28270 [Deinococcus ruber]